MTERVIIVIPIHNGVDETLALLQSIVDSETPDLKIIVVDDGSTDGSAVAVAERFPAVTILAGTGDLWWAGATNLGVREALRQGAEYILTMNNDNVVDGAFLLPLLETVRASSRSIVTSKLLSLSEPGYICSFGGRIDWLRGEIRDRTNRRDSLDFMKLSPAEWVHASSTLYPAALFREVGLFDSNNFPQYHGDADLSLRAAKIGYRLLVEPRSIVYRRTAISGGVTMLDRAGFWINVTSIRSIFYFRANYRFYASHCRWRPFQLFLLIRYARLLYSWLLRYLVRGACNTVRQEEYPDPFGRFIHVRPYVSIVSVIILNWNGRRFLDDCLGSLAGQTYRYFETILVDNGSHDGSVEYVRDIYPWVKLLQLSENAGFAGGNNRGLAACTGEFIVTLNNDTRVEPGFLGALVEAVQGDPRIGMVAAKMLNFYEHGRIDSVGVKVADNGMGYNIGVGERDAGQYDAPTQLFGPCAGAALYRRTMLDQVGFFDPDFFAYYEDLDLAWRGRLAGWSCVTAPQAVVYHIHSATSGRMSAFTVYHVQRNKWYTILKNWPFSLLLKSFPKILVYDVAAIILAVLRGKGGAALRARLEVIRNLRTLLHKRQEVQQMTKLTSVEVAALFAPAAQSIETFSRKMRE